jgi:DNA-binding GntR family transcriptional regulator
MKLDATIFPRLENPDGRRVVVDLHDILRSLILSGKLRPGTVLSQVELARVMNVSRTPVREALRMLQEGGLVSAEPNLRCRVLGFDPVDIEALYMTRIPLEAMGVAITAAAMAPDDDATLLAIVEAMEGDRAHASFEIWVSLHRQFHQRIVAGAGAQFCSALYGLTLRSERFQSAYKGEHLPGWWQRGEVEHREIYRAMIERDASRACELTARHLARTALELLAALAPEYDTSALRSSLLFATGAAAVFRKERKARSSPPLPRPLEASPNASE